MSDFKPIETQEELDRIIGERLARQKEKYADYSALKERVSVLESDKANLEVALDKANQVAAGYVDEIGGYKSQIADYELAQTKVNVALKFGLPVAMAERLQGEDEASLSEDAERFAGFLKVAEPIPPLKDVEPASGDSDPWLAVSRQIGHQND